LSDIRRRVLQLVSWYQRNNVTGQTKAMVLGLAWEELLICAFCGRRPPVAGRLVAAGSGMICEQCVRQRRVRLDEPVDESWEALRSRILKHSGTEGDDIHDAAE